MGAIAQGKEKDGGWNLHKGRTGLEQLRAVESLVWHMTKQRANSANDHPRQFFAKELSGETPPSFSTMEDLYGLAAELYALRPWHVLEEGELVLTRDSATGETCYCSVIGALGEVLAMHAYIGTESYRLFRKIASGEIASAGEFFETQHSVYVEFAPRADLEGQDRKLLTALGHPLRAAKVSPMFRAVRPGFHPWFVTEEEGRLLAECMRAVILVCSEVSTQGDLKYWNRADTYPMVSRVDGEESEPRYHVELVEATLPSEPPLPVARLGEEKLRQLRDRDHAVRGVMELDYFLSAAVIGKKNERKACVRVALAVDADSGIVFPPELASPGISAGDALAKAIMNAIEVTRAFPREVRVQSRRFKDCLNPIAEMFGLPIKIARSLPALAEARASLLRMLGDPGLPES